MYKQQHTTMDRRGTRSEPGGTLHTVNTSRDGVSGRDKLLAQHRMHSMISPDIKSEVPTGLDPVTPLDLRTDLRTVMPILDPVLREKQLQQELLLIQQQQQIQKQLLIAEFQKQHENLTRQHQAQLQEHLKLQHELLAMKQQQEILEREKEHKLEQQRQEQEAERHRREQQLMHPRTKERGKERAVASTEVKLKLQEFLLSKSATKDIFTNGTNHSIGRHHKLWYTAAHHTSLDQSSPPLSGTSPSYKYPLPGAQDCKDDFPLRKTESSVSSSSPVSGPSSPSNGPVSMGVENESSVLPTNPHPEHLTSHQLILHHEKSMNLLSLYTSPSLPNITLALPPAAPQLSASSSLKEKQKNEPQAPRQGVTLPGPYTGALPVSSAHTPLEGKTNSSHQALLQHLLLKEQMRQQKLLATGGAQILQAPLTSKDRVSPAGRVVHKLPRHRPLHRTQSAPLPQNTLAQLVIQQQHQQFLEKQKKYQQQIQMNKLLSKSIEQLRQPGSQLDESEEEHHSDYTMREEKVLATANIRSHSSTDLRTELLKSVKVKEEPPDSDDDIQTHPEPSPKSAFVQQQHIFHTQEENLQPARIL
ncbi:histone deacetylase 9 isoform X3 [Bufo gargarizans]|uniref:histone deacetylase 9 isoform X3 n=1 Tax=Bufo gargarizans TaxID=30331 RepID=UPI001CF395C8|nr:histone deacetylase 9 isoform X3 [Bufo gargarizans]